MRVRFWIPGALTSMTGEQSQVVVETSGGTLQDALKALFTAHPGIQDRVLTERGEIREHINVFVGNSIAARQADWQRHWRTARKSRSFQPSAADRFLEVELALHSTERRSGGCSSCGSHLMVDRVQLMRPIKRCVSIPVGCTRRLERISEDGDGDDPQLLQQKT